MTVPSADLEAAIAEIRSGPQGPEVAAIFDFGGTVVDGFARRGPFRRLVGRRDTEAVLLGGIRNGTTDGEYGRFLHQLTDVLAGKPADELDALSVRLFRRAVYGRLYPEAWQLIRTHQAAGHTVALASSLTRFQVAPMASALGIEHVLCTPMAVQDGILTGYVDGKTLWRNGKAEAVREFAVDNGVDLTRSYAYADSAADRPLLSLVGQPVAVNPDQQLTAIAAEQQWPTLRFHPARRPARPTMPVPQRVSPDCSAARSTVSRSNRRPGTAGRWPTRCWHTRRATPCASRACGFG